ncbi:Cc8K15.2-like protein [Daphnia magna]|uniref:Cc8K15.2-like protein n=1 Tax=Daphnia magna TaxID=35525 RepID=A0A162DE36_9CRUS|nr:Cc8K15.2-like protein [Daphnia magna]
MFYLPHNLFFLTTPHDLAPLYQLHEKEFKTMAETDLSTRAKRPVSRSQTKYWIVGVSLEKFGGGWNRSMLSTEKKRRNQLEQNIERVEQAELARQANRDVVIDQSSTISDSDVCGYEENDNEDAEFVMEKNRKRRRPDQVTIKIPTRRLIQASSVVSDGMRFSQRQQLLVLGSAVTSGGGSLGDITLSKTSIQRLRTARRMQEAKSIMENWIRPPLATLHWDSKLFKLITGKKEDRLAVYASQPPKLLGIPSSESSTGRNQMKAVVSLVEKWSLTECIVALVYDTTASNSGKWIGAAILIEKKLNRAVLRCECRHHVAELHIKHTFKVVFGENKAPTIKLFQRLKEDFDNVDKDEEQLKVWHWPENQDDFLFKQALEVKIWVTNCIEKKTFPREDYHELCELILFYLGGSIPRGFFIRRPGADHHARSFEMTPTELKQVERMAVYIGLFYGKYFLQSSCIIDPEAAKETIKSISRHLSYLTEELVVFLLFDDSLNYTEKTMIGKHLYDTNRPRNIPPNKPKLPVIVWRDDEKPLLSSFVGSKYAYDIHSQPMPDEVGNRN